MGLLSEIKKMIGQFLEPHVRKQMQKHMEPIKLSFSHVARDIQRVDTYAKESRVLLEKWHAYVLSLVQNLERVQKKGQVPDTAFAQEIKQLHKAHTALFSAMQLQQESVVKVKADVTHLHDGVSKAIVTYNQHILSLHDAHKTLAKDIAQLRSSISNLPQIGHKEPTHTSKSESISTLHELSDGLTASEKQLLVILLGTDQRLSYKDIAVNYGRSPSTVKNIMMKLKSKVPLHEVSSADGVKRYYLDESFKRTVRTR
jgi:DNA-binding CsgD family transcriptional regulator